MAPPCRVCNRNTPQAFTTAAIGSRGAVSDVALQAFLGAGFTQEQSLKVLRGVSLADRAAKAALRCAKTFFSPCSCRESLPLIDQAFHARRPPHRVPPGLRLHRLRLRPEPA